MFQIHAMLFKESLSMNQIIEENFFITEENLGPTNFPMQQQKFIAKEAALS